VVNTHPIITGKHNPTMGGKLRPAIDTHYFNQEQPHQGIGRRIPIHYDQTASSPNGNISSKAFLGGLQHGYSRLFG
jgi:hypothetical protein